MTGTGCSHPARGLLDWYVNGTVDPEEEAEVRAHLDTCDDCSGELGEIARIAQALEAARGVTTNAPSARFGGRWVAAASAAAAVIMVGAALMIFRGATGGSGTGSSVYTIDLGSGTSRGAAGAREFAIPDGTSTLRLLIDVPPMDPPSSGFDLIGPDGAVLLRDQALAERDEMGRFRVTVSAEHFRTQGEYLILVRGPDGGDTGLAYRYSFAIR